MAPVKTTGASFYYRSSSKFLEISAAFKQEGMAGIVGF
jgi:hypothetical protein